MKILMLGGTGFEWMVDNGAAVLTASCFLANVVYPGMSYVRDGAFSRFASPDDPIEI